MSELIYFDDLSNYSCQISPFVLAGVKNVGWLNPLGNFAIGDISPEILQKLKSVVHRLGDFRPLVEPIRELPSCEVCGELRMFEASGDLLLNSELWIPSGENIYASPITILHYIEAHRYLPPLEYLRAIEALNPKIPFNGNEIYRQKLGESGWRYLPD
jgi:hypothetical protein